MKWFAPLLLIVCGLALSAEEPVRTWTDLKGATIKASFVQFTDDKVIIRRDDGGSFKVSPGIFSEKDRKYLDEVRKKLNQVLKIDLNDLETRKKIIAEAIDAILLKGSGHVGEALVYFANQETPYTGWEKVIRLNGQMVGLRQYKGGKRDGPSTGWYLDGQKKDERTYKDGKLVTAVAWKLNGEKCTVTNVVNGNGVMVYYNDDGSEYSRGTYKDGIPVED
jgi:hypothetical protein